MEDDLVFSDAHWDPSAQPRDGVLEIIVSEWHDVAAAITDEVVVMSLARAEGLIARHHLTHLKLLNQPESFKLVEDAINARPRNRPLARAERVFDLDRRQSAALRVEQFEQRLPSRTRVVIVLNQYPLRPLSPGLGLSWSHPVQSNSRLLG
jgi:hypothetical protein